jgi:hypothetical protein
MENNAYLPEYCTPADCLIAKRLAGATQAKTGTRRSFGRVGGKPALLAALLP